MDLLTVSSGSYTNGFEIKLTTADFRADAKKVIRQIYDGYFSGQTPLRNRRGKRPELWSPNYFWYVLGPDIPEAVNDEVPEYAGLIRCHCMTDLRTIRRPVMIHSVKLPEVIKSKLLWALAHRYWTYGHKTRL